MLWNPVVISVLVMTVICLLKVNVFLAIIISAVLAGVIAGMPLNDTMTTFISGMSGSNNVALSYILLGALAYGIQTSGLAGKFGGLLERLFGKTGKVFVIILAFVASLSQNVIPIHIAFIPILIPPLLKMMNNLKIDRRAAACALAFGLKAPYMLIPAGFGVIFHNIIVNNITENGMPVTLNQVWPVMLLPALGMFLGLLVAVFITYRKPREYADAPLQGAPEVPDTEGFTIRHWGALIGALAAFVVQFAAQWAFELATPPAWALPVGAVVGLIIMLATGAIQFDKMDETVRGGIALMGFIAFVMLVASGYGAVIRATGGVDVLVEGAMAIFGYNILFALISMQLIGLLITMGIGTSFGTIPIIATVFVPICIALGLSPAATIVMIAAAGATGDAGTPASDTALGPTAGLAADGQHDHIWDTCVPSFLHFNLPIKVMAIVAAMIL